MKSDGDIERVRTMVFESPKSPPTFSLLCTTHFAISGHLITSFRATARLVFLAKTLVLIQNGKTREKNKKKCTRV